MTTTNENRCLMSSLCRSAGSKGICLNTCSSFIALHGASGHTGRLGAANVPADYRLYNTKTTPVRESEPEIYNVIDKYVRSFERMFDDITDPSKKIKSLYLYSPKTGNGKTSTATAVLNTWIIKDFLLSIKLRKMPSQRPGYFLSVMDFHTLYNQYTRQGVPTEIREQAASTYYEQLQIAKEVPFLVLDDIGVRTDLTEAFRGDLHSIIEHRVSNLLPTVYTSNIPLSELDSVFVGDRGRLTDRIREGTLEITFNSNSKRGMRRG